MCFGQQTFPNGYNFYDDFEIGGFDEWNLLPGNPQLPSVYIGTQNCISGSGTRGVTTANPHSGNYSMFETVSGTVGCQIQNDFTNFDPIHYRFYFYLSPGFSISGGGTIQILALNTAGFGAGWLVNITNTGTTGSPVYKLNAQCGGNGTHTLTTGVWHSLELAYSVGAETATVLIDGATDISGSSCSLPTPIVYSQLGIYGTATGTIYLDDVVMSSSAIGSPSANMILRHTPSTSNRTAFPLLLTMWGTSSSDTVTVSMDGTQVSSYTPVTNGMNVQFTCCTSYSSGKHTLLVQEMTGNTVNSSWTETLATYGAPSLSNVVQIDGYNNLNVGGTGIFPILPFEIGNCASSGGQGCIGYWVPNYVTEYGWAAPYQSGTYTYSNLATSIATTQSVAGVQSLVPGGPGAWNNSESSSYPTAQNSSVTAYAKALVSNTNLFGWTWIDEPDINQVAGNTVAPAQLATWDVLTHQSDPNHPVFLNTTNTNPAGKLVTGWYNANQPLGEVYSEDDYPISTWCGTTGEVNELIATWIGKIDQFQRVNFGLVPWNFDLEGEAIPSGTACVATGAQLRMEAWLATIHGAKSITWFLTNWGTTADQLTGIAAFKSLSQTPSVLAALTSPGTSLTVASNQTEIGTRVDAMVKQVGSTITVFGQRLTDCVSQPNGPGTPCTFETDSALSTTFTVNGCSTTGTATVVGESRTVPVTNCAITDTFNADDTHVYQFTDTPENPPTPPTGLTATVN